MKKNELIELIREVIYAELPEIIAEIKEGIVGDLVVEGRDESARQRVRDLHGKRSLPSKPPNRNLNVEYGGEKVASGKGVLDWFEGQVKEGKVGPASEKKHTDDQMKDYMSKYFRKKII